jgi:conjugative transfer signal peptidase TraF
MNRALKRSIPVLAVVLAVVIGCAAAGARINTTASYPVGLYWEVESPLEKGSMVIFCPPQTAVFDEAKARGYIGAGFCPGGYGLVIKKILAVPSDHITVSEQGVCVNGELIPNSKPLHADKAGRPMPHYQVDDYTLGTGQVLLMSDHSALSFDARYFGPVSQSQIRSVIRPVLTW